MKDTAKKIKEAFFRATGMDKVLESPEVQDKKLMRGNAILRSKPMFGLLCGGVTLGILLLLNVLGQLVMNIGKMAAGVVSPAALFLPSFRLGGFYVFGLIMSGGICVFLYLKIRENYRDLNVGQKGDRRFMTNSEIQARFKAIPEKDEAFDGWGGAPVSRMGKTLYIDDTVVNNIIYASTRSGKTEGLVIPSVEIISRAEEKASMIIPDAKGTLTNACSRHLAKRGYRVVIFDLLNFGNTNFYNPLEVIRAAYENGRRDMAEELTSDLAHILYEDKGEKDKFWVEAPRALFSACVLGLIEDCTRLGVGHKVTLYSVFLLLAQLGRSDDNEESAGMDAHFLNRELGSPARLAYTSIEFAEGKTRSSVMTLTIVKLDAYRRSNIAKLTAKNDLEMTEIGFGKKPVAVFLRVPFYTRSYDGIVSAYISQAFQMNMQRAAQTASGKLARRVRVVGDEIFNFPALPNLDSMVTVCLGTGWSFDLYAQSAEQLEMRYNKEVAKVVASNCGTVYFLAANDKDTRSMVSEICGNVTIENVTRSGERFSMNKNITEQFEERALIPADKLTELKDGEMIVFPTMHRTDRDGDKVIPLPIHNKGATSIVYRYEYLPEWNDAAKIPYSKLGIKPGAHAAIDLESLIYHINGGEEGEIKEHSPPLSATVSTATLMQIKKLLPEKYFDIDLEQISEEQYKGLLIEMLQQSDITKKDYDGIQKMLKEKEIEAV